MHSKLDCEVPRMRSERHRGGEEGFSMGQVVPLQSCALCKIKILWIWDNLSDYIPRVLWLFELELVSMQGKSRLLHWIFHNVLTRPLGASLVRIRSALSPRHTIMIWVRAKCHGGQIAEVVQLHGAGIGSRITSTCSAREVVHYQGRTWWIRGGGLSCLAKRWYFGESSALESVALGYQPWSQPLRCERAHRNAMDTGRWWHELCLDEASRWLGLWSLCFTLVAWRNFPPETRSAARLAATTQTAESLLLPFGQSSKLGFGWIFGWEPQGQCFHVGIAECFSLACGTQSLCWRLFTIVVRVWGVSWSKMEQDLPAASDATSETDLHILDQICWDPDDLWRPIGHTSFLRIPGILETCWKYSSQLDILVLPSPDYDCPAFGDALPGVGVGIAHDDLFGSCWMHLLAGGSLVGLWWHTAVSQVRELDCSVLQLWLFRPTGPCELCDGCPTGHPEEWKDWFSGTARHDAIWFIEACSLLQSMWWAANPRGHFWFGTGGGDRDSNSSKCRGLYWQFAQMLGCWLWCGASRIQGCQDWCRVLYAAMAAVDSWQHLRPHPG